MTTTDRLRHEIDSGCTKDKVAAHDPAAAPLGTDEEAAGTPPSKEAIELARSHEVVKGPDKEPIGGGVVYLISLGAVTLVLIVGSFYFDGAIGWLLRPS